MWDERDDGPVAWERRVWVVALVWVIPGAFGGAVVAVFLPDLGLTAGPALGVLFGAVAGGTLEAEHWGV